MLSQASAISIRFLSSFSFLFSFSFAFSSYCFCSLCFSFAFFFLYWDIYLANGSKRRECPDHFHETHIMITRNSCNINHRQYPCRHSNTRLCGHTNTKAQGSFPHSSQTSVSMIALLSSHTKHLSPFWHSGKSFVVFTLQVHIYFFKKKPFVF